MLTKRLDRIGLVKHLGNGYRKRANWRECSVYGVEDEDSFDSARSISLSSPASSGE